MAAFVRLLCGVFIGVLSLSACGGSGGGGASSLPAGSTKSGPGTAALSVFVPAGASGSARRRNLPSSTQSVEIAAENANGTVSNPPILPTIANVSATAPGCSSVSGGVSCTIDVSIPYGSYIFAVVAFTGQNATGTPIAWGETTATIGPTGSNAVTITTSSVIAYFTMDLDGNISLAAVDHNANTIAVANTTSGTSIGGSITNLSNGDEKIVVTSSSDTYTPLGSVVYARELPGDVLVFFSTGTSTPPSGGYVASGADWGVGTALTACPTAAISPEVSVASVEGSQFQVSPNFTQAPAFENGTAAISVTSGTATLAFSGAAYTLGGSLIGSQNGTTGACSGGIFAASSGSNGSGEIGYNAQGVVIGTNMNPNGSTSITNGFMGFTVQSGSTVNLAALTSGTYDGFLGYYNVISPTNIVKGGSAIAATPGGSNTLNWCAYTNFEAGTVGTGSSCQTVTFTTQPQPGIVLGSIGSNAAVFDVSLIDGKYLIFGVESVSGVNFVLIEH